MECEGEDEKSKVGLYAPGQPCIFENWDPYIVLSLCLTFKFDVINRTRMSILAGWIAAPPRHYYLCIFWFVGHPMASVVWPQWVIHTSQVSCCAYVQGLPRVWYLTSAARVPNRRRLRKRKLFICSCLIQRPLQYKGKQPTHSNRSPDTILPLDYNHHFHSQGEAPSNPCKCHHYASMTAHPCGS